MVENFSQGSEQEAIVKAFEGRRPGRILELGAYHPWMLSNSRALILSGWSAVMVDVAPLSVRSLIGEYGNNPKITIVQAAVGLEREWITFHTSDDATTTSDEAMFLRWNGTVQFTGKMTVSAVTLEDIGTRFGSDFDFVSIDTEGTSYLLFKRMMQLGWEPRCVCCENDGQVNEMQSFAAQYGYTRTLLTGENGVFVK